MHPTLALANEASTAKLEQRIEVLEEKVEKLEQLLKTAVLGAIFPSGTGSKAGQTEQQVETNQEHAEPGRKERDAYTSSRLNSMNRLRDIMKRTATRRLPESRSNFAIPASEHSRMSRSPCTS